MGGRVKPSPAIPKKGVAGDRQTIVGGCDGLSPARARVARPRTPFACRGLRIA